ncbi:PQQ-binding-like beta-propeller repeat protein [Streptomyces sp. NPDC057381]|uniref:outer membrane protein assembly factor BamB family protein n=1 Tax=Streptomyces sp. NPDC057381 TaxID=3346111 RepID=UPI0036450CAB
MVARGAVLTGAVPTATGESGKVREDPWSSGKFWETGSGMAQRSSRPDLRAAGAGLLVVVLLVLLVGDGRMAGKPSGPPNTLEVAWSYVTTGRALDARHVAPALSDEVLAVPVGRSVRVVDTRSGRLLSIVNGFAEETPDLGLSGGVLFLVDTQDRFKDTLRAYDPGTGGELWHRKAAPGPDGKGAGDFAVGGLLLTDWGPVVIDGDRALALEPHTGAVRWNVRLDTRCANPLPYVAVPYSMAATSTRLLLLRHCTGETAELQAVDERDGRSVWRKRLGRGQFVSVSAADGALGVRMDDEFRLLTESGEEVLRQAGTGYPLGGEQGIVYAGVGEKLRAFRADTGKPSWKRARPLTGFAFMNDGLIVEDMSTDGSYSGDSRWSVGDAAGQEPGASTFVDLDGRRTASVPWPVAGTLLGASGELLVVRSEEAKGTRYTGLRPGYRAKDAARPVALGGTEPRHWPDACGLVAAGFLSEIAPDYLALPDEQSRTMHGVRLPHPSVCRFATESGDGSDVFSVTVRWVAPDATAARTYADSAMPWGCTPALGGCVTAGIEEPRSGGAWVYTYRTGLEARPVAHATVVSGRYVLGVAAGEDEPAHRALVRRIALHLSQGGGRAAGWTLQ